ncbi:MAG: NAD(P)/FAD-dependent oxidoreductase [Candidatus Amulumruptor caecigallinarius]|nr:NAD(P)/FAD-dependent oxidoreductase [Candidatus Amulumruptor caecigallinarius]MCM1396358.1 NAD(P)/FAD-dependent oxidoreductase [Candidatus Amulumruptor caecigallinarius]MCM1453700.1 NAD(P)/FAD-dependent oxidoreductase [bacterium]
MKGKCIIIGSGLGGLACGGILARNGYDVSVLEQGSQPGGCLQCFSRGGVRFETGMHFIGSALPGQTLHRLMRYLGFDSVKLSRLDPEGYDVVKLGGESYRFANGREPFISRMSEYFPAETDNIVAYYDLVQQVAAASSLHSLRSDDTDMVINTRYQTLSINEVLECLTPDRQLRNVLAGTLPLYAARRGRTPFAQHAFIMDFYNRSAFRIEGGSDNIAKALIANIRQAGGEVLTRNRVSRIFCDSRHATGVEVNGDTFLPADYLIADIHPARLMELLDSPLIRPATRRRMLSLPQTVGGFSVYVRFKENSVPYLNHNVYSYRSDSPWGCEDYSARDWPKGYLYMHFCDRDGAPYARSGVILSYMNMADVARWAGSAPGHRGVDYEAFKRAHADKLLECVERDFPGLRQCIDGIWTSTPLTYRDYTGTEHGSMYGVARDISLGPACRVAHRTRVPNLFLTGQNINSHGMLGVLVGAIVTCSELLSPGEIYRQITEAGS